MGGPIYMAKTALSTLYTNVGYNFEITPSNSSDPTKAEIIAWINEAQREITRIVPWWGLKDSLVCYNPPLGAVSAVAWSGLESDFYKFAYATLNTTGSGNDLPARLITPEVASGITTNSLIADSNSPVIWFDATNINFYPATTGATSAGKLKFYYIKQPTNVSNDYDTLTIPREFEDACVYYATYKGKAQEEEWQQAMQMYQLFVQSVANIVNMYARHKTFK